MATLEEITDRIRHAAASDADLGSAGLGASIRLELKGEGVIHIAGTEVSNADLPADLIVTVSRADLEALGRRELDPVRAMMTGRLKLSDMGLAMRLQPQIRALFSRAS
ncbi:SCP2 sterol-binding domain-containing protein [Phenylobacterium sp.]|jgi:putative sterol carrier protein|uniref:SCP2 sterol-binding domain-containing protein n=1 Tax=Phenylobacterium sp. TaxID=1871053 RepID=UPI0037842445